MLESLLYQMRSRELERAYHRISMSNALSTILTPVSHSAQVVHRLIEQAALLSAEGIISFDRNGDCIWMNHAAIRMLRLSDATSMVGRLNLWRHATVRGHPDRSKVERASRGETVEFRKFGYDLCSQGPSSGAGNYSFGYTRLMPLLDHDGQAASVYAFHLRGADGDEVGSWAEANCPEHLLEYGIATAKQMTRRVTHDFNNLISVIQGYTTVLQGRAQLDSRSKELAGLIELAGSQLASVTDRMARFAEVPSQERVRLNLNKVVSDFIDQTSKGIPENVNLCVDLSDQIPDLVGDENRLKEVCENLWRNAIESMPKGGILSCQTNPW